MKCSNYVGETLDMARELGVKGILFISHIGKFVKVAGGIMNTHSRQADSRSELMAANAIRAGADLETAKEILDTITTEQSVEILKRKGYLEATMKEISDRVEFYLNKRAGEQLEVGTILFPMYMESWQKPRSSGTRPKNHEAGRKKYTINVQIKNRNQINRKTRRKNYEWNIIWTWSGTGRSGTADTESPSSDPRESCDCSTRQRYKASVAYQIVKGAYPKLDEKN